MKTQQLVQFSALFEAISMAVITPKTAFVGIIVIFVVGSAVGSVGYYVVRKRKQPGSVLPHPASAHPGNAGPNPHHGAPNDDEVENPEEEVEGLEHDSPTPMGNGHGMMMAHPDPVNHL